MPAREAMSAALAGGPRTVLMDLSRAAHDDRVAMVLVLVMRRHAERHGVRVHLLGASPWLTEQLRKSGLIALFGSGMDQVRDVRASGLTIPVSRPESRPVAIPRSGQRLPFPSWHRSFAAKA